MEQDYEITGLTIAVNNMPEMLAFYAAGFDLNFVEKEIHGFTLYASTWGSLNLLFCPAELARNTATQNRHQFDVIVPDIQNTIKIAIENGGQQMGTIQEDEASWSIGIYDPDKNSIIFKQMK